eukprot:27851-Chlamydomonas_euryale.AAC.1
MLDNITHTENACARLQSPATACTPTHPTHITTMPHPSSHALASVRPCATACNPPPLSRFAHTHPTRFTRTNARPREAADACNHQEGLREQRRCKIHRVRCVCGAGTQTHSGAGRLRGRQAEGQAG